MATETTFPTDIDLELRFRLQTLIIDGGADILWNMFHQRLRSKPLNVFLANEKTNVNRLLEDKKITQTQYDHLYPRGGQSPSSAKFDITIIVSLLINLPSLGINQNFKWHVPPQPKDMSFEADLLRLMGFINEIDHIWSTMEFNKVTFQRMLTEIQQVLVRLNSTLPYPLPNYNQKIDKYKNCSVDTSAIEKIKKKTKQWREIKKGLEWKVVQLDEDVNVKKKGTEGKDVEVIKKDIEAEGEEFTMKSLEAKFKELPKPSQEKRWMEERERWIDENKRWEEEYKQLMERDKRFMERHKQLMETDKQLMARDKISTELGQLFLKSAEHGWRDCLQMTDKARQLQTARALLGRHKLPDQAQVRLACSVFGRCSETFLNICSSISKHIKSKSNDFIDVWAAYRYCEHIKDDDIKPVFVVITREGKACVRDFNFDIIERDETEFSTESEKVLVEVENDLSSENIFPDSKLTDIEKCVSLNADSLMDKHKNLNIVSPSVKKSKKFGKSDAQISDELCIALYVHIKGLIPIAEEPFPSKIGEFCSDVLEGGFKLFHGGPYDYHAQLKMGLAIHANVIGNNVEILYGTLGGFLDYQPFGMCALTCAHVILSTHEMQQLVTRNQLTCKEIDKEVFQSALGFGIVVLAVYRTGDHNSSGIDAALIKITQRHPRDGFFPAASNYADAGFDESNRMVYNKGKVSSLDGIRRRAEVYKYGIATGVTKGSLGFRGTFVKTSEMYANNLPFQYRMCNQIEVLSTGGVRFADHGDSGALVFFDDKDDDSVAIGIVVGGHTNNRTVYVTPICEILNSIGADVSMTKFMNDGSVSNDSGLGMDTS